MADLAAVARAARRLSAIGATSVAVQGFLVVGRLAAALGRRRQAIAALDRAGRPGPRRAGAGPAAGPDLRGAVRPAPAPGRRRARAVPPRPGRPRPPPRQPPVRELRALASGHGAELGAIGMDVVLRDGSPTRVLNWMERSRAAALLAVEPPEFSEIRADCEALRAGPRRAAGRPAPPPPAPGPSSAATQQAVIENRIRQRHLAGERRGRDARRPGDDRRPARPADRPGAGRVRAAAAMSWSRW